MSTSLQTVALANGDTAPHSLSELYSVGFTDGTSSPSSGIISLSDFAGKTIGSSGGSQTFSYSNTNLLGNSNQGGTWRGHTYTSWTLPTGFSSNSSNFSFKAEINNSSVSGGYFTSGNHYGNVVMRNPNNTNAAVWLDTSAGNWINPPVPGVSGASYNGWSKTATSVSNASHQLSAGDTVEIKLHQYVEWWPSINITFTIVW